MEDQGVYECQINTEPKMKMNINLMVKGDASSSISYSWASFYNWCLEDNEYEWDDIKQRVCVFA